MKNKKLNKILAFLFIVLILIGFYLNDLRIKNNIVKDYYFTRGKILDYFIIGVESSRTLKYEYYLKDKKYIRKMTPTTSKYDYCDDNFEKCKGKEFWVICSKKNPSKSLIDLSTEIQGIENPELPENTNNFE